jgi:hypothetical protein
MKTPPSYFVQPEFIPSEYKDKMGITKGASQRVQTGHWVVIYAFLGLSYADRLQLKCMCRLFRKVEIISNMLLKPIPSGFWTPFPHPTYPTLNDLVTTLNARYAALSDLIVWEEPTAPELLSVGMRCQATFEDATIEKVNDDETFDVVFDEGRRGTKKNVPLNELKIQTVRCC